MTTGELITALYDNHLNIGVEISDDNEYRARILLHAQQAVNRLYPFRPWPWSFADDDVSIAAGASAGDLPLTFGWAGPYMGVYVSGQMHKLRFRVLPSLKRALELYGGTASRPTHYSIGGAGDLLATPSAPTVSPQGTPGATTYSYTIVAEREDGTTTIASTAGTTATGNAVLSATNFNRISWAAVPKAARYDVYRTVGGATQGKIKDNTTLLTFDDTGIAASGTSPVANTTSNLQQLHVWPRVSVATTIQLRDYKRKPPTLIDEVVTPGGDNGQELKQIPTHYHETLLYDYVVKRLMRDEGDSRDQAQELEFRQAMAEAWADENNQTPRRAPRYGRVAYP